MTFALFTCASIPRAVFCQTERLGVVQYTPPAGWSKTLKENAVAFSDLNRATGRFCIITVYGATPSAGNPQADFTKDWNNLVVSLFKAEASPKTETRSADGWTITAGGAAVEAEVGKSLVFLTVISGFGKTVSVLAVLNDQSYMTQLGAFIESIHLDKAAAAAAPPAGGGNVNQGQSNTTPGKFGSVIYTKPAGWGEQAFPDGVVLKPSDLPAGEHLTIQIMPPLNASGTLEQALAHSYDEAVRMHKVTKMNYAGGGNYQVREARRSFRGWEYIRGSGGIQADNGTPYKDEFGLDLFVVRVNQRFERVAVLKSRKNCNLSRYYSSDRLSYRRDIENFLFSLRFADWNEPALEGGSAKGAGVIGVWQGISLSVGQTSAGERLGVRYKVFSPIFLTNGQAYFGAHFPPEGLDGLNTRIPAEQNLRDWGTYSFSNGRGVLKMPYADIPLRAENNKFIITPNRTDHGFVRLPSVDGATFHGTYALGEVNGVVPTITFTSDGGFTDRGALKVLYHEYVECLNPALAHGSGRYEVKNYSVIFNYADGRRIVLAFLGAEYDKSNPSPATLRMSSNEDKMERQ